MCTDLSDVGGVGAGRLTSLFVFDWDEGAIHDDDAVRSAANAVLCIFDHPRRLILRVDRLVDRCQQVLIDVTCDFLDDLILHEDPLEPPTRQKGPDECDRGENESCL